MNIRWDWSESNIILILLLLWRFEVNVDTSSINRALMTHLGMNLGPVDDQEQERFRVAPPTDDLYPRPNNSSPLSNLVFCHLRRSPRREIPEIGRPILDYVPAAVDVAVSHLDRREVDQNQPSCASLILLIHT